LVDVGDKAFVPLNALVDDEPNWFVEAPNWLVLLPNWFVDGVSSGEVSPLPVCAPAAPDGFTELPVVGWLTELLELDPGETPELEPLVSELPELPELPLVWLIAVTAHNSAALKTMGVIFIYICLIDFFLLFFKWVTLLGHSPENLNAAPANPSQVICPAVLTTSPAPRVPFYRSRTASPPAVAEC
jgi:hypothetical protein